MDDIGKARLEILRELQADVVGYLKREFNRAHTASLATDGCCGEMEARVHEIRNVIGVVDSIFYRVESKLLKGTSGIEKEGEGGKALPHR